MTRPKSPSPPQVRLAHVPGAQGDNVLKGRNGVEQLPRNRWPALLVSYFYLDKFLVQREKYAYRDWMMDSGAFSAYNSGAEIDLGEYIEACVRLREEDSDLAEIIALDVIARGKTRGAKRESGRLSLKNAIEMRDRGADVIPVFHIGEEWDVLLEYCKLFDKVGLSCRFGEPTTESLRFYDNCFSRIWPKKTHSFGWIDEKMLLRYPFHSSDSSSWEVGPAGFGTWKVFGKLPIKGSDQNLRPQVEWYLQLEERLRERWRNEMILLDSLSPVRSPTVRLSAARGGGGLERLNNAFRKEE